MCGYESASRGVKTYSRCEYKKARPRRQPDQVLGGSMAIEHCER